MEKIHDPAGMNGFDPKSWKNDPTRLGFHLMPPVGWLNDPNGLSQTPDGFYHIFFQFAPGSIEGNTPKQWGHYATKDFRNYLFYPDALLPDEKMDRNGAYSGSAVNTPEGLLAYYTGNVKKEGNYDYILNGREQNTILASQFDGKRFLKKECILTNEDYPNEMSLHVRDPKVFIQDGKYVMLLGARTKDGDGAALVYESDTPRDFHYSHTISYPEHFGYMWECPDLFSIDGDDFLIFSPQGLESEGDCFENVYQSGYAKWSDKDGRLEEFRELDHGFDFYAPQTFTDQSGRTILIGWMGLPDTEPDYFYPENPSQWTHALTVPRVLKVKDSGLTQTPIEEIDLLRGEQKNYVVQKNETIDVPEQFDLIAEPEDSRQSFSFILEDILRFDFQNGTASIDFLENSVSVKAGAGRKSRRTVVKRIENLRILKDRSSIELFMNNGETVFTSRFFAEGSDKLKLVGFRGKLSLFEMMSFNLNFQEE